MTVASNLPLVYTNFMIIGNSKSSGIFFYLQWNYLTKPYRYLFISIWIFSFLVYHSLNLSLYVSLSLSLSSHSQNSHVIECHWIFQMRRCQEFRRRLIWVSISVMIYTWNTLYNLPKREARCCHFLEICYIHFQILLFQTVELLLRFVTFYCNLERLGTWLTCEDHYYLPSEIGIPFTIMFQ